MKVPLAAAILQTWLSERQRRATPQQRSDIARRYCELNPGRMPPPVARNFTKVEAEGFFRDYGRPGDKHRKPLLYYSSVELLSMSREELDAITEAYR